MPNLNSLNMMGLGAQGSEGGNRAGQGFGIGSGLENAIDSLHKYALEKAQADKLNQQMAWEQNPNNPENKLRMAQAGALNNTKNMTIDGGLLDPKLAGKALPLEAALPYVLQKLGVMGGGKGKSVNGLSAVDNKTVEDLSQELSQFKGAYDTANKNNLFPSEKTKIDPKTGKPMVDASGNPITEGPGLGTRLKNDFTQGLLKIGAEGAPFIGNEVANNLPPGAMDYNSRIKDTMYRVAKILNGGRPNAQMQEELQKQAPQVGLLKGKAEEQFNALISSAEARAQALVDSRRTAGDEAGAQALSDQFNGLFGKFRIGQEGAGVSTNLEGGGINPTAKSTGTILAAGAGGAAAPAAQDQAAAGPAALNADRLAQLQAIHQKFLAQQQAAQGGQPAQAAPAAAGAPGGS